MHSIRRVVRFEGIADRDGAEALLGRASPSTGTTSSLTPTPSGTTSCSAREVVDDAGSLVGVLEATLDGAAHDYLVVARPDGGEVLVPAVAELVDVTADRIVVRALPGLLDDAEPERAVEPEPPAGGRKGRP